MINNKLNDMNFSKSGILLKFKFIIHSKRRKFNLTINLFVKTFYEPRRGLAARGGLRRIGVCALLKQTLIQLNIYHNIVEQNLLSSGGSTSWLRRLRCVWPFLNKVLIPLNIYRNSY